MLTYSIIISDILYMIGQVENHSLLPSVENKAFFYIASISQSQLSIFSKPKSISTNELSQRYI